MDAIALFTIPAADALDAPLVIIDGLRGDAEARIFRSHFHDFILIGIVSSFEKRLSRLSARGRSDDLSRAEDLRNRDRREETFGLGRALAEADRILENDGSLETFEEKARSLLEEIRGAG